MPKMKTHRGAAKRFRVTGTGKLMRKKAYDGHLHGKKSSRRKRRLERDVHVASSDSGKARRLLGAKAEDS